jgi:hypothetical protein
MEDVWFYLQLGWEHILSPDATDHLLYLLVLVLPYRASDFRSLLLTVTGFTLGHSLTLFLSATRLISVPVLWAERLIPLTIFITALVQVPALRKDSLRPLPGFAAGSTLFGTIHGLGFAGTLRSMLGREQSLVAPVLGFNAGVELAQCLVLLFLVATGELLIRAGSRVRTGVVWFALALTLILSLTMFSERMGWMAS